MSLPIIKLTMDSFQQLVKSKMDDIYEINGEKYIKIVSGPENEKVLIMRQDGLICLAEGVMIIKFKTACVLTVVHNFYSEKSEDYEKQFDENEELEVTILDEDEQVTSFTLPNGDIMFSVPHELFEGGELV